MHAYVQATPGELTLLASSEYDPIRNEIWIRHLYLPEQTCTPSSTRVDENAMAQVLLEATQQGDTLDTWIHSHADMNVFFSGVDDRNIETAFPQSPQVMSLVVNRRGEMRARLTLCSPMAMEIDDLPVVVGVTEEVEQAIREEVRRKVRTRNTPRRLDPIATSHPSNNGASDQSGVSSPTL